jgi:hypothetical protein
MELCTSYSLSHNYNLPTLQTSKNNEPIYIQMANSHVVNYHDHSATTTSELELKAPPPQLKHPQAAPLLQQPFPLKLHYLDHDL